MTIVTALPCVLLMIGLIFIHWSDKKTVANKRKKEKKT